MARKIIVVVPVKNEVWILHTFLQVTSHFADAILLADQQSDDGTPSMAETFPKVTVFNNPSTAYNDATRQKYLIEKARELYPGQHIIIALDADEIASADSLNCEAWNLLHELAPGTLLYFKKTDLLNKGIDAIDLPDTYYPLGFVDDGLLQHSGKPMHSVRVPTGPPDQPRYEVPDILFLHLQRLRPNTQEAKRRFYQVKEKDFGMNTWYWRRKRYHKPDFMGWQLPLKPTPQVWLAYPQAWAINFANLKEAGENWFDTEVYQLLQKHGGLRYWLDDIWDKDWNAFYSEGKLIIPPPTWFVVLLRAADKIFNFLYSIKVKFFE
jgi:hypothetical protein